MILPSAGLAAALLLAAPGESLPGGLTALDPATGDRVALDWASGPTHVAFVATWCRPCLAEVPRLFDLEDRWKPEGYRLVLMALPTRQSAARLREFLSSSPLPGRLLFDDGGSVTKAFGISTIPAHVLVDRRGREIARAGALDGPFTQAVERDVRQEGRSRP